MTPSGRIVALFGVRDEIELVRASIDHLWSIGVELTIAFDGGSTDGTREVLDALQARGGMPSFQTFSSLAVAVARAIRYAAVIVDVADDDCDETVICGVARRNIEYRYDADIPAVLHALDVFGFH